MRTGIHNEANGRRDYHWRPSSSTYVSVTTPQRSCWEFVGRSYWEYEVVRRTACRLRVRCLRRYDVYCRDGECAVTGCCTRTVLGVFSRELSCERTMKPDSDVEDGEGLERGKELYTVTRLERGQTVKYDVENKELVVADL